MSGRPWTPEDCAEMARRYPHEITSAIAASLQRTERAVYLQANLMGLKKTREFRMLRVPALIEASKKTRFSAGNKSWNTGLKGVTGHVTGHHPNSRATQFTTRHPAESFNWRPIGSLRVNTDGYLERKITDDATLKPSNRWEPEHRLVWMAAHGDIPPGHVVVFRSGMATTDPDRITVDCVELITRVELMQRNTRHNLPPEINELYVIQGAITRAINKRMNHEKQ